MMTSSVETRINAATAAIGYSGDEAVGKAAVDGNWVDASDNSADIDIRAGAANLAYLFGRVARLYTGGEASSLSQFEAAQLVRSLKFVLGLNSSGERSSLRDLATQDPSEFFAAKQRELAHRVDAALEVWGEIVVLMPPIRNIALRDTLAGIGQLKSCYDTYFAAHEVPCDIDYQLHTGVDPALEGLDYIEAYLAQLLEETRWLARFAPESCIAVLDRICPDYRGLHVNLVDLLKPYELELQRR